MTNGDISLILTCDVTFDKKFAKIAQCIALQALAVGPSRPQFSHQNAFAAWIVAIVLGDHYLN